MSDVDPRGTDWSDAEIDLVVADYFAMLASELAGDHYVKAQHNSALQELTKRSRGSIEFKHQNISAVLVRLGLPWIPGYKPLANFQAALLSAIEQVLEGRPEILTPNFIATPPSHVVREISPLFFEPAPSQVVDEGPEPEQLRRLVRKFDPAERDARNRSLGKAGEEHVIHHERSRLRIAGRDDLSRKVRWTSQEDGDGAGYDIRSFDPHGNERLIEVKTTCGAQRTPFFISENERSLSEERAEAFRLVRLYEFCASAKAFELTPPLENWVKLKPTNYRASFMD